MNPRLVPFAALLRSSDTLFERCLSDLDREQGLTRFAGQANPPLWIAAHLASSRYGLGLLIGLGHPRPWGERFNRGSELGELATIPGADEIRAAWTRVSEALRPRLAELSDADLDAPSPRKLPIDDPSVLGAIAFLVFHEAYHIGQLALARKALGMGSLVG